MSWERTSDWKGASDITKLSEEETVRNEHVVTEVVEKVKARVDTIAVVRAGSRWQNTCVFPMFHALCACFLLLRASCA